MLFILPMWVNILVRTLATVALFDFAGCRWEREFWFFRYDIQFYSLYDLSHLQYLAEDGQKLHWSSTGFGANSFQVFWKVIFPLSMPGVVGSGIMMVFMPTISTLPFAELLTMNNIKLFGTTIQENINNSLWNYGSSSFAHHVVPYCRNFLVYSRK